MVNPANYVGGVAPGANDTAIYSTDYLAANGNVMTANKSLNIVNGNTPLQSITIDYGTSATYSWSINSGGTGTGSLLLTDGGTIQVIGNQSSALVTNIGKPLTFAGNYTFDSSTASASGQSNLVVQSAATLTFSSAGPSTLTLKGTAGSVETVTGQTGTSLVNRPGGYVNSVIADGGVGAAVSVVKDGAGVWQLGGANTYTGGTTIKQGSIVIASTSASLGTGTVTLGDSATGQDASLIIGSNVNIANAITVDSGSGLRILGTNAQSNPVTFSGAITLNSGSNLRLQVQSSRNLVIDGGITGTGNVEVYHNNSNQSGSGIVFNSAINNIGTVTNASPGAGTLTQTGSGVIDSNVTEFIQNSATSTTTLSLANSYGATTVLAGTLETSGTGTLGTGNVTVNGGSLLLGSSISLSDTAILNFINSDAATITLNNATADTVYGIYDMTSNASIGAGTWTADDLNTFFGTSVFTGTGQLTTLAAVPEPSSYALGILGLAGVVLAVRRRRRMN